MFRYYTVRLFWLAAFLVSAVNAWKLAGWFMDPSLLTYASTATFLHIGASVIALAVTFARVIHPAVPVYVPATYRVDA